MAWLKVIHSLDLSLHLDFDRSSGASTFLESAGKCVCLGRRGGALDWPQ